MPGRCPGRAITAAITGAILAKASQPRRSVVEGRRVPSTTTIAYRSHWMDRTLLELLPDALLVFDVDGRFVDANAAACELLGLTRQDVLASTLADVLVPVERAWLASLVAAVRERAL